MARDPRLLLKGIALTAVVCLLVALGHRTCSATRRTAGSSCCSRSRASGSRSWPGFVKRIATSYTITNRRLHIKRGIVSRTIQETRLERVQNVNFSQSVVQRMLQVGDVDFDTAAGDDYNFVFAGVAEPADVVHEGRRRPRAHWAHPAASATSEHGRQPPPAQ